MKKNILRLMTATMTAAIILSATGCGKNENNNSIENYSENDIAQAINEYDKGQAEKREQYEKEFAAKEEAKKEAMQANNDIVPTDEILEADIFDYKIQIGNKCYTFPISVQEFMDSNPDFELDDRTKPLDTFDDGSYEKLYITYNGCNMIFAAYIPEEKKESGCTFAEYLIQSGSDFYIGSEEKPSPFILPKGIAQGTTIEEFEKLFNVKNISSRTSDTDITYSFKGNDSNRTVQVKASKETQEIQSITYIYWN